MVVREYIEIMRHLINSVHSVDLLSHLRDETSVVLNSMGFPRNPPECRPKFCDEPLVWLPVLAPGGEIERQRVRKYQKRKWPSHSQTDYPREREREGRGTREIQAT